MSTRSGLRSIVDALRAEIPNHDEGAQSRLGDALFIIEDVALIEEEQQAPTDSIPYMIIYLEDQKNCQAEPSSETTSGE